MNGAPTRGSFFGKVAVTGAALKGGISDASAAKKPFKRKSPSSMELIEIGVVTCAPGGSHIYGIWGTLINPTGYDNNDYWPRQTGMVMTKVWDPMRENAEDFAKKYDVEIVDNYYDMVDKVDGVILSDFFATGWWPQLSKPYLEAGMPTLLNRPFAQSLSEAQGMVERSKRYNAPILVPSGDEMMFETMQARTRVKKLISQGAKITGVMAFEPTSEYPAHGIHCIYNIYAILGPDVVEAGLYSDNEKWWDWGLNGALMNWKVRGEGDNPDYFVSIRMSMEPHTNGWIMISTTRGRVFVPNDHAGVDFDRNRNLFLPTVIEFQRMIETGKQPQSHEYIMAKTRTFLTGFYSLMERNGNLIPCKELPDNWRAPELTPDLISEEIFK